MIYEDDQELLDNDFKPKKTKSHKAKSYQNIIIGAGLAGLLSAILVSKDRSATLLIDKNSYLGGYINTHMPVRNKCCFYFDNWWPLDLSQDSEAYKLLEYMNAFKRFKTFKTKYLFKYCGQKENVLLVNGGKPLFAFLKQKYPLVYKQLNFFYEELIKIRNDYNYLISKKFDEKNTQEYLEKLFANDLSILSIFNTFWIYFGISYDLLDIYIFLYNIAHYLIGGFHYICDGSNKMINTLEEICHVHGINIKLNLNMSKAFNKSSTLRSIKCEHVINKQNVINLKADNYFIASSLDNFINTIDSKDPSFNEYKQTLAATKKLDTLKLTEITIYVGFKKNLINTISEEMYYFDQIKSENTKEITEQISQKGYSTSPIVIYNQNKIYKLDAKYNHSLVIKIYDIYKDSYDLDKIKNHIQKFLQTKFLVSLDNIYYLEIISPQDLNKKINRNYGNYVGDLATTENGWMNRTYQTIFNNVLISSIDGVPGIRGNSIFITTKFLSNINDVGLTKYKKFSDIDHMNSTELVNYLVEHYTPVPKYFGKTIGITIDEKNSYFLKILNNKVEVKETDFEKSMEANYYVWTFNAALKDILSYRSSVMKKVFTNKMRVKGGAFYLNGLMKKIFKEAFISDK